MNRLQKFELHILCVLNINFLYLALYTTLRLIGTGGGGAKRKSRVTHRKRCLQVMRSEAGDSPTQPPATWPRDLNHSTASSTHSQQQISLLSAGEGRVETDTAES